MEAYLKILSEMRPISGFEKYLVHPDGFIFSQKTNRILSQHKINSGYMISYLWCNNKHTGMLIHRAVALNFVPNPSNKPQVNHIDANKLNNHVSNLEWSTASENSLHSFKVGDSTVRRQKASERMREMGFRNAKVNGDRLREFAKQTSKPVQMLDLEGNFLREFPSIKEATRVMKANNIARVIAGKFKQAGGYKWRQKPES